MQGPVNTLIMNGAGAVATAAIFCAMQVAYRHGLTRAPRWWDVTENENEFATPYFGRIN